MRFRLTLKSNTSRPQRAGTLRIASLLCCVLTALTSAVQGQSPADDKAGFRYSLKSAIEADAEKYLVEKVNFRTFHEKFGPNCIYWGVNENDIPASLTFHFPLEKPLKSATLHTSMITCDFGVNNRMGMGKSSGSVWLSADGKNWNKVLDVPSPKDMPLETTQIHIKIPDKYRGSRHLWVQFRMIASGMGDSTYSTGQIGRKEVVSDNFNVFDLRVRY